MFALRSLPVIALTLSLIIFSIACGGDSDTDSAVINTPAPQVAATEVPPSISPTTGPIKINSANSNAEGTQAHTNAEQSAPMNTSVLRGSSLQEFERNLPDLSDFANNKSDRFIVDFEDVIAGHPYPGQRSPVPHNDAQVYFSNTDVRWRNAENPSDYPPIYAVADGIITGVDSYSLNDHTKYDPPWWHAKYGLGITFAKEGDVNISFIYAIEPYINLENKPNDFYEQFILVKPGQVVRKGDVIAYMYVPSPEEKVGVKSSTHVAFALSRQAGTNRDTYAPAIFSEDIVEEFSDLWLNPKEGWGSPSYGNDWARARGVPVGMGWMIDASENPFTDLPLDVISYDGVRDLDLDGQARLNATDIGFAKEDLLFFSDGNGDYLSEELDIPVGWQIMVASIGGPMSITATLSDGRTMSISDDGPGSGFRQRISPVMQPGLTSITVSDPSAWGWAFAIAPAGSPHVIPGANNPDPSCPPGCPPLP